MVTLDLALTSLTLAILFRPLLWKVMGVGMDFRIVYVLTFTLVFYLLPFNLRMQVEMGIWAVRGLFVDTTRDFVLYLTKIVVGMTILAIGVTGCSALWRERTKLPKKEKLEE